MATASPVQPELLRTLPSDAARQIQWRFADRYDLQMLVQSARAVARGPVARLVANGGRNSHEWTEAKAESARRIRYRRDHRRLHGTRSTAASSPARRIWRWRWLRLNWPGWTAAPRPPVWPVVWRWRRFTNAAPPEQQRQVHEVGRAASSRRRPQALAGRVLPDRAHPLRRRGYRHVEWESPHRRVEAGRRAGSAGGKARALHHQHRLCQFCDGGG